jgi:outer membrane lipoprotein-sorting protein
MLIAKGGIAAELSIEEITKNMENALETINDISFKTVMRTMTKGADINDTRILSEGNIWFKRPCWGRHEFHLSFAPEKKHTYIYRVEGDSYFSYEILEGENKINKMKYPLETCAISDVNPEKMLNTMKKFILSGLPYTIGHENDLGLYIIRFSSEKDVIFQIKDDSWLFHKMINENGDNITEFSWEDLVINTGVSDNLFLVPLEGETQINESVYATKVNNIEITRCGAFQNVTEQEYWDPDKLLNPNNMIETDQIEGKKGAIFGCVFTVRGEPSGADATGYFQAKVLHPDITNPNTGKIDNEERLVSTDIKIDRETTATIIFWSADDYKIVPGKWTFQFYGNGVKMAEKVFTVL